MIRYWLLIISITASCISTAVGQKTKKVTTAYTYFAPENVSLEEAKQTALQRAKIQAIAEEFGTIVTQSNATVIKNANGQSEINLHSLGTTDVKGEWLKTEGKPEYKIAYEEGMLSVSVRLTGIIREIVNAPIDFQAKLLCNGTEDKFEQSTFRNGDDLYLSFLSPVDGYLTVYLTDAKETAYCLLPYRSEGQGSVAVKANQRYLFFSAAAVPPSEQGYVDEYTMTCENDNERNQIYIVFSPRLFTKATDQAGHELQPRELSGETFREWLFNCRKADREMRVEIKNITIQKN